MDRPTDEPWRDLDDPLRTALVEAPVPTLICDETGAIRLLSQGWIDCSGYSAEELPTLRDWTRLAHGADGQVIGTRLQERFAASGTVHEGDWSVRVKGGGRRLWEVYATPLGKDRAGIRLLMVQAVDRSERRAADADLARLGAIAGCAIIGKSLEGIVTSWNQGAQQLFGYTAPEMLGEPIARLIPPDRLDEEARILARLRRGERVGPFETVRRRKDGRFIDVSLSLSPLRDGRGHLIGASKIVLDVSGRKAAEAAAREAAEQVREQAALLELAPVLVRDLDSRIVLWTHGAEQLYGFSKEEALNRVSHELFQTQFPTSREQVDEALRRTGRWEGELVHRTRDGERLVVASQHIVYRDAGGRPARILEVNADVTERKDAERALRESQARLAGILESAMDAILSVDESQRVVLFNAAAERVFGCAAAEALGQPLDRFLPARSRAAHRAHVWAFGETGVTSRVMGKLGELSGLRANGEEFPIEAAISQTEVGGAKLFTVVLRDVTERTAAEAALAESEARFRALTESLPQLAWTCGPDGFCDYLSPQWVQYVGMATERNLGDAWLKRLHPNDRPRVQDAWQHAVRTAAHHFDTDYRLQRADGTYRWFKVRAVALRDDAGRITKWLGYNTEVEDLKQAEERLRALNAELTGANQELEAFSYSVSHDLRAPLRHLIGFAKLLQDKEAAGLSARAQRYLDVISAEALRMGTLIDELLAFSRAGRTSLRPEPVDLEALAREAIEGLAPETRGRRIRWDLGPLPVVEADPTLLRGVLTNLLHNALKFTRGRPEAHIQAGCRPGKNETIVFIRDNGAGFDMQYADKLFGVFQRLHSSEDFEGSGVGLANVRRIIQRHGGRVWAEGVADAGATFYFSLPDRAERRTP